MNQDARQRSLALERVTNALARWTVEQHEQADGTLSGRWGERWRERWINDTRLRLNHLAQALAVREPKLFTMAVHWSRDALNAREAPVDDLRTNVKVMGEVMAEQLTAAVRDPAMEMIDASLKAFDEPTPELSPALSLDQPHGALAARYLEAVLDWRGEDAQRLIREAAENGGDVRDLYEQVIVPAQVEIGRMWHRGEVEIADEHHATAVTQLVMTELLHRVDKPTANGHRVVTTGAPGELHELSVRMISNFFMIDGWTVLNLGPNMPAEGVVDTVRERGADLLALSTSTTLHLRELGELIDHVRGEVPGLPVIVGGLPFQIVPELWRELGADGSAETAREAVRLGASLVEEAAEKA